MALTPSTLITAAKRLTFGVTGAQKIPDAMLLEEINHQEQIIVQMLSQVAPDLLSSVDGSETVTLVKNKAGYSLTAGIAYRDFTHVDTDNQTYTPITVIQRQFRDKRVTHPAITIVTGADAAVIFPVDPNGDRWLSGGTRTWFEDTSNHKIEYSYVATPTVATTLTSTLTSPDMSRQVFIAALELAVILTVPEAQDRRVAHVSNKYEVAMERLRWQAHKFVHPQGSHGITDVPMGASEWVSNQVQG